MRLLVLDSTEAHTLLKGKGKDRNRCEQPRTNQQQPTTTNNHQQPPTTQHHLQNFEQSSNFKMFNVQCTMCNVQCATSTTNRPFSSCQVFQHLPNNALAVCFNASCSSWSDMPPGNVHFIKTWTFFNRRPSTTGKKGA